MIVPIVQFARLDTSYTLRKKIQICIMFGIGIVVTIVSVLRLQSLILFMKSSNFTVSYGIPYVHGKLTKNSITTLPLPNGP